MGGLSHALSVSGGERRSLCTSSSLQRATTMKTRSRLRGRGRGWVRMEGAGSAAPGLSEWNERAYVWGFVVCASDD
jgi:hypothetical protein